MREKQRLYLLSDHLSVLLCFCSPLLVMWLRYVRHDLIFLYFCFFVSNSPWASYCRYWSSSWSESKSVKGVCGISAFAMLLYSITLSLSVPIIYWVGTLSNNWDNLKAVIYQNYPMRESASNDWLNFSVALLLLLLLLLFVEKQRLSSLFT